MEVLIIYEIRENSMMNLHMPLAQIQLSSAHDQSCFIYTDSPMPYSCLLDSFEVNTRHNITSPLNISVCVSERQDTIF